MTKKQFERKHPDVALSVQVLHDKRTMAHASWGETDVFVARKNEDEMFSELSKHVLAIQSRRVMEAQGWRDANTGQHGPLQAHHVKHRARGGTHAKENLAAVSPDTHRKFHEEK